MDKLLEARLINNNIISVFNAFGAKYITMDHDVYCRLKTGYRDIYFNLILLPKLFDLQNVEKIGKYFKKLSIPFCWWVDVSDSPKELFKYLEENGYEFYDAAVGMSLDLATYKSRLTVNKKIKISIADKLSTFKACIKILGDSFQLSEESHQLYINSRDRFITVGAHYDGELVSTSSIFIHDDVAGLHNDATLEPYRKNGIMSALYDFRLKLLQELGIKKAVIHAFPMAISIAKKFGFQPIVNYKLYTYGITQSSKKLVY